MNRRPLIVTALLWIAFASFVGITAAQLPENVATHFGANGAPNGWMTRREHVQFTLMMGLVVPAFVLGIFAITTRFQEWMNIPYKDYWLAPERRQHTVEFIQRQGFRFAGLFIVFIAAIHWSIVAANRHTPAGLPISVAGWIGGGFLAAMFIWVLVFIGHFFRKPA